MDCMRYVRHRSVLRWISYWMIVTSAVVMTLSTVAPGLCPEVGKQLLILLSLLWMWALGVWCAHAECAEWVGCLLQYTFGCFSYTVFVHVVAKQNTCYLSIVTVHEVRGPFEKFGVSRYYSESELCGGALTVSSLGKRCTYNALPTPRKRDADRCKLQEDSGTGGFLTSELTFHG
jgi:hypothetical protein